MFGLAIATLRHRKGAFVATFLAIFLASALIIPTGGLMETGIRLTVPADRLAGAPIVVTGVQTYVVPQEDPDQTDNLKTVALAERQWLEPGLLARLRALPGVGDVVGEVSVPATVLRDGAPVVVGEQSLGHDWASARLGRYEPTDGGPPAGRGQVVLDTRTAAQAGVGAGDRVPVAIGGAVREFVVSGLVDAAPGSAQSVLFFSGADLAMTADRYSALGVLPEPGADVDAVEQRVSDELGDEPVVVLSGDSRGRAEYHQAVGGGAQLTPLASVFLGMAVFVSLFVVASTLGLSVQQRQRELAVLRAIGATPRQVRRMVFGETMLVAFVGAVLGVLPAILIGPRLHRLISDVGVISPVVEYRQGFVPYVAGPAIALLAAALAGLLVGRRAAGARPGAALAEAAVSKRWVSIPRMLFAVLFLGGGFALILVTLTVMEGPIASATAGPAVLCWAVGLALLAPGLTKTLSVLLSGPVRLGTGAAGYLASANLRRRSVRMGAVVAPIMLLVGIAVANLYSATTQSAAAQKWFSDGMTTDVTVSSATGGFGPDVVDRVRETPGVTAASQFVTSAGWIAAPFDGSHEENPWPLQGLDAEGAEGISGITPTTGTLTDLVGETVAVPDVTADDLGAGIGDTLTLRMGDRQLQDVRIVATFETAPGYEYLVLPADLLAEHTTSGHPRQILVATTSPDEVRSALGENLGPGVAVAGRDAMVNFDAGTKAQAWVNYLLIGLLTGYTTISVANTLVMSTGARRRELGMQRLIGATRPQIVRMLAVEAVLIGLIGVVLGTVAAMTTLVPLSLVLLDRPFPAGPLWIFGVVTLGAIALTLLATLVPARRILAGRAADAALAAD